MVVDGIRGCADDNIDMVADGIRGCADNDIDMVVDMVVQAIAPKVMMARNEARYIWIISFPIIVLRGATAIAIIAIVNAVVVSCIDLNHEY